MSAWDQTVVIGRKARPGGSSGGGGPRGPTALERAKQVGAVTANDRKSMYIYQANLVFFLGRVGLHDRQRRRDTIKVTRARITSVLPSWTVKMMCRLRVGCRPLWVRLLVNPVRPRV